MKDEQIAREFLSLSCGDDICGVMDRKSCRCFCEIVDALATASRAGFDAAKEQAAGLCDQLAAMQARAEAAEAELARLRKPVGEVKGVVRSLSLIACAPRCEHASECNCTVLDNAADLIQRLAAQAVGEEWLVWSHEHNAWWGPRWSGYRYAIDEAGRYTHDEAMKICIGARGGWEYGASPPELPVRLSDAMAMEAVAARYRKRKL